MSKYKYTIVIFTHRVSVTLMNYLGFTKTDDGWEYSCDNIAEAHTRVTIANDLRYDWLVEIRPVGTHWVAEIERGIDEYAEWEEYYGEA